MQLPWNSRIQSTKAPVGIKLLEDPSYHTACRRHKSVDHFIPFTNERDGIGRLQPSISKIVEKKGAEISDRTRSSMPNKALPISYQSVKLDRTAETNAPLSLSSTEWFELSQIQCENLHTSIEKMFIKDRQELERREMLKRLGEQRPKIAHRDEEKRVFPVGFYDDTKLANYKFPRAPVIQFQRLRSKVKSPPNQPKKPDGIKSHSTLARLPLVISQEKKKQVIIKQPTNTSLDIDEMEKNPDLQRAARMRRLSIPLIPNFEACHNEFKEKMKLAKMRAIQIKQKIDSIELY